LALRLIEAFVSANDRAAAAESIGPDAIAVWSEPLSGDRVLVRALMQSAQVEAATDRLKERFPDRDEFRIVVIPVEAAIPDPPESRLSGNSPALYRRYRMGLGINSLRCW
jgi:hypothetical protein